MKKSKPPSIDDPIHFIGICGAGMTPLAIIMKEKGYKVSGSDIAKSPNIKLLESNNIKVFCGEHNSHNLPAGNKTTLVISSAIKDDNPELISALKRKFDVFKRGEFLAKIANSYKKNISVGGSHGKTTITAMIAHIFKNLDFSPGYMIGGKVAGWSASGAAGNGEIFIAESDESDGTQKNMYSGVAVISNVDDDHSWNFEGGKKELFANFAKFAKQSQKLIYGKSAIADKLFSFHSNAAAFSPADTAKIANDFKEWPPFQRFNALLAINAVAALGMESEKNIIRALKNFPGVERRMSVRFNNENFLLIEDYAHHPAELSALFDALLKIKKKRKLRVVFQPHRYARLKKYFKRFVCELRKADSVTVLPVFSAWSQKNKINSEKLAKALNRARKNARFANFANSDFKVLARKILLSREKDEILAVVGAGDCNGLVKEILKQLQML